MFSSRANELRWRQKSRLLIFVFYITCPAHTLTPRLVPVNFITNNILLYIPKIRELPWKRSHDNSTWISKCKHNKNLVFFAFLPDAFRKFFLKVEARPRQPRHFGTRVLLGLPTLGQSLAYTSRLLASLYGLEEKPNMSTCMSSVQDKSTKGQQGVRIDHRPSVLRDSHPNHCKHSFNDCILYWLYSGRCPFHFYIVVKSSFSDESAWH